MNLRAVVEDTGTGGAVAARRRWAGTPLPAAQPEIWHERLSAALAATTDSRLALAGVCSAVRELMGCDRAQIWRGDVRQFTIHTLISSGYAEAEEQALAELTAPMFDLPLRADFVERKLLVIPDVSSEIAEAGRRLLFDPFGITGAVFVMIERADRSLGALQLSWCGGRDVVEPAAETVEIMRRYLGLAVDIHAHTEDALRLSETLSETAVLLGSIHDPEELLGAMARKIGEALGCDWGTVHLVDEDGNNLCYAAGYGGEEQLRRFSTITLPRARVERELADADDGIVEVANTDDLAQKGGISPRSFDVASYITVPFSEGGSLIGLLTVGYRTRTGRFSRRQITLAKGLAHHALVALRNARLVRSLRDANQVKADFIAAVSHDLRTPLHVLIGYSQILLEEMPGPLNDEQRGLVRRTLDCSMRFLDLVGDILEIARLDAGRDSLTLTPLSMRELCEGLAVEVEEMRPAPVELLWDVADVEVQGDRGKIKTILRNLIGNALKFTEDGTVEVAVSHRNGDTLVLRVTDNGPGIDSAERAKIFEMFRQGDAGRRQGGTGLGLGLYLVKRLAGLLGGSVELVSGEPGNTVFEVRLPARASS